MTFSLAPRVIFGRLWGGMLVTSLRRRDGVFAMVAVSVVDAGGSRALRFGIGWDDDLPLSVWPAHRVDLAMGDRSWAWCGVFVGLTARDRHGGAT